MTGTTMWICPGCARRRRESFCPSCGEERLRPRDLTLRDIAAQFAKGFSTIDGKWLRSFGSLLTAPGTLTAAHVAGRRRTYLGPLALFLIANAIFVALQSLTDTNILSSPLASHLQEQDWRALAREMVARKLAERHETLAAYTSVFDGAALFNAKALIVLMVLAFAPLLPAVFRRPSRPAGAHIVFALHFYAFVLLLLSFALLLAQGEALLGGDGLRSPAVDVVLSLFNLGVCGVWLFIAIGRAYGSTGLPRLAKAAVLAIAVGPILIGYRFAIFLITFYAT